MHYLKATCWVVLSFGLWIISHFVALILGLGIAVFTIAHIIKAESEDGTDD